MIEVIDPLKGTLVFSQRFSTVFDHFSGRTRLAQVLQSQRGEVSVAVWQLTLRQQGGGDMRGRIGVIVTALSVFCFSSESEFQ